MEGVRREGRDRHAGSALPASSFPPELGADQAGRGGDVGPPGGAAGGGGAGRLVLRSWLLLLLADGPAYGYQLAHALRAYQAGVPDTGSLYQALRKMEARGVVASAWEESAGGPPHRVYRLTAVGAAALDACAGDVARLYRQLGGYLARYHTQQNGDGRGVASSGATSQAHGAL